LSLLPSTGFFPFHSSLRDFSLSLSLSLSLPLSRIFCLSTIKPQSSYRLRSFSEKSLRLQIRNS
jgi:hypothetical protein